MSHAAKVRRLVAKRLTPNNVEFQKSADISDKLVYVTDQQRHLVCVPYSIENLHRMAEELNLKRHWFHKNHYDLPLGRKEEIEKLCKIVHPKEIVEIIRSPECAHIIIESARPCIGATPKGNFMRTQMEIDGTGGK